MALYVFALVDAPPARPPGRGLLAPLTLHPVAGAYAVVERRADVPPVELGMVKAHHRVLVRIARSAHAIIPVRFGTLLESSELREALDDRDEELAAAFDAVRDRVQFTWRDSRGLAPAKRSKASAEPADRHDAGEKSGTAYMRRLARKAAVPASLRTVRGALGAFVVNERFEPGTSTRAGALYHLVSRESVPAYRRAAGSLDIPRGVTVAGPFPPFAFVPEYL